MKGLLEVETLHAQSIKQWPLLEILERFELSLQKIWLYLEHLLSHLLTDILINLFVNVALDTLATPLLVRLLKRRPHSRHMWK